MFNPSFADTCEENIARLKMQYIVQDHVRGQLENKFGRFTLCSATDLQLQAENEALESVIITLLLLPSKKSNEPPAWSENNLRAKEKN
mmetsp:Transcript_30363/g.64290  ORF Transcript_30363/g.64290 Transcript_30363/m.64290 type:complete len:88 (-) Transcript_30363:1000-1263(-)